MQHATVRRALLAVAVVLMAATGCSDDEDAQGSQTLVVSYYELPDEGEAESTQRTAMLSVDIGRSVARREPEWSAELGNDCDADTQTLSLTRGNDRVDIGAPCSWWNVGVPSPDGSWLAAHQATDGAAGELHLIDLRARPTDTGAVAHSLTTFHTAAWTDDGRVWFANDAEPPPWHQIWSMKPGATEPVAISVPGIPENAMVAFARVGT